VSHPIAAALSPTTPCGLVGGELRRRLWVRTRGLPFQDVPAGAGRCRVAFRLVVGADGTRARWSFTATNFGGARDPGDRPSGCVAMLAWQHTGVCAEWNAGYGRSTFQHAATAISPMIDWCEILWGLCTAHHRPHGRLPVPVPVPRHQLLRDTSVRASPVCVIQFARKQHRVLCIMKQSRTLYEHSVQIS